MNSCKLLKKVCNENERKENNAHIKNYFGDRRDFIKLYQKNVEIDFNELWVIDCSHTL